MPRVARSGATATGIFEIEPDVHSEKDKTVSFGTYFVTSCNQLNELARASIKGKDPGRYPLRRQGGVGISIYQ